MRYIIMHDVAYENMWPADAEGTDADPLQSFESREAAEAQARVWKMGREFAVLAIEVGV